MNDARELFVGYSPEVQSTFAPFIKIANEFAVRNRGKIATLSTPPDEMKSYADELIALGKVLVTSINASPSDAIYHLYKTVLIPSREVARKSGQNIMRQSVSDTTDVDGPGMVYHKGTRYNVLEKVIFQSEDGKVNPRTLFVMVQNLPTGFNTGGEIHGVALQDGGLVATNNIGGMELHIPLRDETIFYNNGNEYRPKPLEGILTLPGDVHSLQRQVKPAINIILMAYGAGLGVKVNESLISKGVAGLGSTPKTLPMQTYSQIPRHIVF